MEFAQESLAGRASILHMSALSQAELYGEAESSPFSLTLEKLNERQNKFSSCGVSEIYERIWLGGMP